jgi:16S rRNA (cytidine1402-2'-O)-methyltransferase
MSNTFGKLSIVATPIGNLSDMTFRAVDILKSVDCILCEDTRTTKKLLDHYQIKNKTISFHTHSGLAKVNEIKDMIREGKNLALVSDAGTPCISDPGVMLVAELNKEFGDEMVITPVPGASALISALSASGLPAHEFSWKGFVPHKKGRETFFKDIASTETTVIFYESVHRFMKTMESLVAVIPNREVVVAREITKMFEEFKKGTVAEVFEYYKQNPDKVRGEFVIMVGSKK